MATKCFSQVRGRVVRVTRLDACGEPVPGQFAVAVSNRISSVALEEVTEEGNNVRERNFADELFIKDDGYASTLGYGATINLLGVDPDLIAIFTDQRVVKNALGHVVGFAGNTSINLDDFAFALEIWTKLGDSVCDPSGNRQWGYTPFPYLKGGRLGGFTFENGAVSFTINGAQTRDGNRWGVGPYDVDLDAGGNPAPLFEPLDPNDAFQNLMVSLDPPAASCGAFALASV